MDWIIIVLFVIVMLFIVPALLQWLWNMTIPELFGSKEIRYWQAFRLIIICQILFGATSVTLPT